MSKIPKLETEILSLDIVFYCRVDRTKYDLGGVYIEREGRKYAFDIVKSTQSEDGCTLSCELEVDEETFPMGDEYPYTLVDEDLNQSNELMIAVYIGCEYDVDPESVTLFVRKGTCTIALEGSYE